MTDSANLLSVETLSQEYSDEIKVLDASWYLPTQNIDSHAAFCKEHIDGAQFFDIDEICDQQSPYPHMLPDAQQFSHAASKLGILADDIVVIYDTAGLFSAARVWWMFKVFGHKQVRVLDGGLPAWIASGGKLTDRITEATPSNYQAKLERELLADRAQIEAMCKRPSDTSCDTAVLDARPTGRFKGTDPEPRANLSSGHMPDAVSLPASAIVNNGFLRGRDELLDVFASLNINANTRLITTCGSGVTAAIITLALAECGYGLQQLYDGAWAEWAATVSAELIVKDDD